MVITLRIGTMRGVQGRIAGKNGLVAGKGRRKSYNCISTKNSKKLSALEEIEWSCKGLMKELSTSF